MTNKFKQIFSNLQSKAAMPKKHKFSNQSYFYEMNALQWSSREYEQFADQAYIKNVIAHRSINIIAQGAASVPWALYKIKRQNKVKLQDYPLLELLHRPNPFYAGAEFFENIYAYKLISGNAFIQALGKDNSLPKELHILRPDRVSIVPDDYGNAAGYI